MALPGPYKCCTKARTRGIPPDYWNEISESWNEELMIAYECAKVYPQEKRAGQNTCTCGRLMKHIERCHPELYVLIALTWENTHREEQE